MFARDMNFPDLYGQLDRAFNTTTGTDMGFEALVATKPYPMEASSVENFRARYRIIKSFQQQTLELFKASLIGERDPEIARMVVGDIPLHMGLEHHRRLTESQHGTPTFFRTDEPIPGKLSEIQCPGSGWCINEQLRQLYRDNPEIYGRPQHFPRPLAEMFAEGLKNHLGCDPVVHHLTENASRPHGMRYFIQQTRSHGVRYFSYDQGITANDCNFVRSHDFVSLLSHNFYADRMERCNQGDVIFDLSPSALFDSKLIMAWPFWKGTRDAYTDEVRDLFPYTTVIGPEDIELEDRTRIGIDEFCERPKKLRDYFIKYAGTDISINWGSKSVFLASSGSKVQCRQLMESVQKDWALGKHWVLQSACRVREQIPTLDRNGQAFQLDGYGKWSGFYGPDGLMGILVFHKNFQKVHGSADTVMGIVY